MLRLWCLGFQVCYVCKSSDFMVKWSEVILAVRFICVVCWSCLNIPVYIVVYAQILEQLLHKMRETKNLGVTGAAHKPCKAWGKSDRRDLRCQVTSPWHELFIRLARALTLLTCTLEATGLNLRQDTICSGWLFWDSPQYLQMDTLNYVKTALYHVPYSQLLGLILQFSDTVFTQI